MKDVHRRSIDVLSSQDWTERQRKAGKLMRTDLTPDGPMEVVLVDSGLAQASRRQYSPDRVDELRSQIREGGACSTCHLLVDRSVGHHPRRASPVHRQAKCLGLHRSCLPCCFDYLDEDRGSAVDTWPGCGRESHHQAGDHRPWRCEVSGRRPKTSRHHIDVPIPTIRGGAGRPPRPLSSIRPIQPL